MGAWGSEAFENDDGSDWVYELEETDSLDLIVESLTYILDNQGEYLERPECSRAIAAAETLATMLDGQSENITEDVQVWIAAHAGLDGSEHVSLAFETLGIIGQGSELRELWEDSIYFDEWQRCMTHLSERLRRIQNEQENP